MFSGGRGSQHSGTDATLFSSEHSIQTSSSSPRQYEPRASISSGLAVSSAVGVGGAAPPLAIGSSENERLSLSPAPSTAGLGAMATAARPLRGATATRCCRRWPQRRHGATALALPPPYGERCDSSSGSTGDGASSGVGDSGNSGSRGAQHAAVGDGVGSGTDAAAAVPADGSSGAGGVRRRHIYSLRVARATGRVRR